MVLETDTNIYSVEFTWVNTVSSGGAAEFNPAQFMNNFTQIFGSDAAAFIQNTDGIIDVKFAADYFEKQLSALQNASGLTTTASNDTQSAFQVLLQNTSATNTSRYVESG